MGRSSTSYTSENNPRYKDGKYKPEYVKIVSDLVEEYEASGKMMSMKRIALKLGVDDETVKNWSKRYPDFRAVYDRALAIQCAWLEERGVDGSAQPHVVKFLLSANHGFIEKTAQDMTVGGNPEKPFKMEIVIDGTTEKK